MIKFQIFKSNLDKQYVLYFPKSISDNNMSYIEIILISLNLTSTIKKKIIYVADISKSVIEWFHFC